MRENTHQNSSDYGQPPRSDRHFQIMKEQRVSKSFYYTILWLKESLIKLPACIAQKMKFSIKDFFSKCYQTACFNKCKKVKACFKLVNQFMSKLSMIQAPANEKDSLNIQEVKCFLNLRVFTQFVLCWINCLSPTQQCLIHSSGELLQSDFW